MSSGPNLELELSTVRDCRFTPPRDSVAIGIAEGYERWAETYDHTPNALLAREERYLTPLLLDLERKLILDLACGTGRWLEKLLSLGAHSGVGIDCSNAMLRVARMKTAVTGRLALANCVSLPFNSSIFDLAICSFALGHIRDLRPVVQELALVMKSGADVFVSDLHQEAYARGWRTGFRDGQGACEIENLPRTAEEIIRVFHTAGFECLTHVPLCLGDPEKPIFATARKLHVFAQASQVPAVLVCHFRRLGTAIGKSIAACEAR